jgi:hypothetical protein
MIRKKVKRLKKGVLRKKKVKRKMKIVRKKKTKRTWGKGKSRQRGKLM